MAIGRVENDPAELTLKRPDPTVTGMTGSVTAVAFLVERPADRRQERKPKPGIWIDFYLTGPDGRSHRGSDETKPEDGSATVIILGLQPGGYLIEARVRDHDFSVVDRFTVTASRLKPAKVEVTFFGHRGQQQLYISVTTEEGLIIPSAVATVIEGNNVVNHNTSKPYQMDFSEPSRAVEVRSGNTSDLVWQGRLLGPSSPGFPSQLTHSAI